MKKSKRFLLLMLLVLSMGIFSACGKNSNDTNLTPITLNEVAHSLFYAPLYVAIEEGYFEEEGIDLTLVTGFGADKTMTALLSNEAEIGFMGSESTIYTYQGNIEDYVINFAGLTQRAGNFLVSREPYENFTWDMLKGSTVLGGRAGGMPEMVFEYILSKNNMDPKADLTIVQNIDFGSTAAAFMNGQGDFSVEFEPHATAIEEAGKGYVIASLGEASGYVPYTSFCAKKSYIEENPSIIQAFTNALQKGLLYVNSHTSEEIAKIIKNQFPETETSTISTIVERYKAQDTWKENLIFEESSFDLLQNILEDSKVLTERVPYTDLVNTAFAYTASETVR